ncbi:hypothetical protein HMPREF3036_02448 [Sutterella sp. KLE1602]|nr:hypothetical protein HMPREF3036_02448 [Sutterella sp. KLE1602]
MAQGPRTRKTHRAAGVFSKSPPLRPVFPHLPAPYETRTRAPACGRGLLRGPDAYRPD